MVRPQLPWEWADESKSDLVSFPGSSRAGASLDMEEKTDLFRVGFACGFACSGSPDFSSISSSLCCSCSVVSRDLTDMLKPGRAARGSRGGVCVSRDAGADWRLLLGGTASTRVFERVMH